MDSESSAVRDLLRKASRVAVLTGAGISAESGIPTFRGSGGLWRNFKAEDLATPGAFASNPKLVWEWYDWRREVISRAEPNAAHYALAEWEQAKPEFTLITQNVDGLHDRAGNRRLLKLHGDIWTLRCTGCGRERLDRSARLEQIPPRCSCGALERPGVVWYGEGLPDGLWTRAQQAAQRCEAFLAIGTSAVVYPATALAEFAKSAGAAFIEVNIAETEASARADYSLRGSAAEVLPELI